MNRTQVMQMEEAYQLPTYNKKPIVAEKGEGAWIWDADGTKYLDLYGGHCVALLGHNHPDVTAAVKRQLDQLHFYSNAVYSPIRGRAAKALVELSPASLAKAFFCNSGTEANETALKLARKTTGRDVVLAMEGDFHGRTLGSLATTWGKYRTPYADIMAPTDFVPFGDADAAAKRLAAQDVAAVILEPIQSMAGVYEAKSEYYLALSEACAATGTLLIFDEIQTGVGRTGTFSIAERYGMVPDMVTLAKSLGSGLPVGAVLVTDAIADQVAFGDQGTTFGGGMLAMAAVEATLEVIVRDDIMGAVKRFESAVRHALTPMVRQIRGRGCLLGLDLGFPASPVVAALLQRGIIVGGANDPNVIRLMPPAVTPVAAVDLLAHALKESIDTAPRLA